MSQSSAALNSPNPMKKKVITALIAVVNWSYGRIVGSEPHESS